MTIKGNNYQSKITVDQELNTSQSLSVHSDTKSKVKTLKDLNMTRKAAYVCLSLAI